MSKNSYLASLPARTLVPVFFFDQDRSWEQPCRILLREECRSLKERGLGKFVDNGRAFQLAKLMPIEAKLERVPPPSNSDDSEAAISLREQRAYAGDGHAGLIAFAREKVEQWKLREHDQKAPIARGRWRAGTKLELAVVL